jgi:hypothetical protein
MTGCPISAETLSITTRDITSVALPGVRGTIRRIGLVGQACVDDCAHAGAQAPGQAGQRDGRRQATSETFSFSSCGVSRMYGF